jgi:hypothetical protein
MKESAPPPDLVQQWGHNANLSGVPHNDEHWAYEQHIATRAAQWGADQELEACCQWLEPRLNPASIDDFRAARRPKPPSLKEQALAALPKRLDNGFMTPVNDEELNTIRRALEALPND